MKIVSNAFSLNMLTNDKERVMDMKPITLEEFTQEIKEGGWESSVGHGDMASLLSEMTGEKIPANRRNDSLGKEDILLVAQYSGPRLPEGATKLPEGAKIVFWKVWEIEK